MLPPAPLVLRTLREVDVCDIRVVILGQDPYHGHSQAIGRSFAVNLGEKLPPSLSNIFKELAADVGFAGPADSSLSGWSQQGVLLLNTVLTVEQAKPMSHRDKGWETFSANAISYINERCPHVVYMLWGAAAAAQRSQIDESKHLVLASAHPSPLSAHRGFFGSRPFSRANEYLRAQGLPEIDWTRSGSGSQELFVNGEAPKQFGGDAGNLFAQYV